MYLKAFQASHKHNTGIHLILSWFKHVSDRSFLITVSASVETNYSKRLQSF